MLYNLGADGGKTIFEDRLKSLLSAYGGDFYPLNNSAVKYSLDGGKRIRPLFLLNACAMFGQVTDAALDFACALEILHVYTLLHDDLPCMDNDDIRRGKLTCHKKFGESAAVLTGDALLNLSYEIITDRLFASDGDELKRAIKAAREFSYYGGGRGVVKGQFADLAAAEKKSVTEEEIEFIYRYKTGALLMSACVCGAVLGGADENQTEIMREFGYNYALAFQITDDLLDGKKTGECSILKVTDEKEACVYAAKCADKSQQLIKSLKKEGGFFISAAQKVIGRKI